MGPLTLMVDSQRDSSFAQRKARTTDLAQMVHGLHRQNAYASPADNRAWAQQLLNTDSDAESRSKPMSLSTQGYSNTHSGYTSDVPESRGDPEDGAYDFASRISHHGNEREMKAPRYQQLAERDEARQMNQPKSISTRGYSNTHPGYSSDVPESREAPEEGAWDFATRISSHSHERENAVNKIKTPLARQQQLALVDDNYNQPSQSLHQSDMTAWDWANNNDVKDASDNSKQEAAKTPRMYASPAFAGHQTAYSPSKKAMSGYTSAIPEDHDTAEGTAWGWAADQFAERHRMLLPPTHDANARVTQQKKEIRMPTEEDVNYDVKLIRQLKIAAARQAMGDLHASTQRSEDINFARKVSCSICIYLCMDV